jgi:DNA polymerase-3 subunit gamma/tau
MLTKEAFNALLKTLEEPPAHVKFMFATTEPEKVLPTILSRCQRYDLRRIPVTLMVKYLAKIARLEEVNIDEVALIAIARGADGCLRDAESTLDQLISFCGEKIMETDVLSMFGLAARSQVQALAGAVLAGDMDAVLSRLDDLARNGKDLGRLLSDLLNHFRNLLLFQVAGGNLSMLEVTETEAAVLKDQSGAVRTDALMRVMEVLTDCEGRLREATSKKILVEVTLLKAIQARTAFSLDEVLGQLQRLRAASAAGAPPAPAELREAAGSIPAPMALDTGVQSAALTPASPITPAPAVAPVPVPLPAGGKRVEAASAAVIAGETDLATLWGKVVEAVGRASPFTRSYLLQAHPVALANQVFTIGFDPEFADNIELVGNPKNRALIQTKLREMGCGEVQVKFIKAEPATQGTVRPAADVLTKTAPLAVPQEQAVSSGTTPETEPEKRAVGPIKIEDFKNDPLIKEALEIFKAQIVEVRA